MGPEMKERVLASCASEKNTVHAAATSRAPSVLERADVSLMAAIQAAQRSFVITDPSLPDNPITFASKGFLELSGYALSEVLGRNCRFLQGPDTDQTQVEALRNGILKGEDTSVCFLNYRADGTPFYNQVFVAPLRDADHRIINYVGVQVEIKPPADGTVGGTSSTQIDLGVAPKKGRPRTRELKAEGGAPSRRGSLASLVDEDGKPPKKSPRRSRSKTNLATSDAASTYGCNSSSSSSSSSGSYGSGDHGPLMNQSLESFQMSKGMDDLFFLFEDQGHDAGGDTSNVFNFDNAAAGVAGNMVVDWNF